jgi:Flp pilus assembly protein TadB
VLLLVLAGIALLARVPAPIVIGAVAMSYLSLPFIVGLVAAAACLSVVLRWRNRPVSDGDEGDLLRHLSGRVAAGATIRSAIADTTIDGIPAGAARLAALGRPMASVGDALVPSLPTNGAAFRGICSFSEHTGAAISSALSALAEQADEATEHARQRRISLAQVKLSAIVVGVVPIAVSLALIVLRGVPEPGGAMIVLPMIAGVGLQLLGTAIVFRVASRSAR